MSLLEPLLAYGDWGLLVLRVVAGAIFLAHGMPKLFGPQPGIKGFTEFLKSQRVPLAPLFGVVVPLVEFFGGIALILGFLTPWFSVPLGITMLVAWYLKAVQWGKGFAVEGGWEFDVLLLAVLLLLLTVGAGSYSLDARLL